MTRQPPPRVEQLWEQALDTDPLVALRALHQLRFRLRLWEHQLIQESCRAGHSWRELAEAVGTVRIQRNRMFPNGTEDRPV